MEKPLKIVLIVLGVLALCGCLALGGLTAVRVSSRRVFGTQTGSFSGAYSVFPGQLMPGARFGPIFPGLGLFGRLKRLLPFRLLPGSVLPNVYDQVPAGDNPFQYLPGKYFGKIQAGP